MTTQPIRPTHAVIDLAAIQHNVRELRRLTRQGAAFMAVVKADGYGHGAVPAARAALAAGADWLGVAVVEEAAELRQAGLTAPTLVLGWLPPEQAGLAAELGIAVTVFDAASAQALDAAGQARGRRVPVHIKVDTGMGRVGVRPEQAVEFARTLAGLPGLEVEGIFTHLATADEPDPAYAQQQLARFDGALAALTAAGLRPPIAHAANSAGIMAHPAAHHDLVRAGISLYGLKPDPALDWPADLRPAMSLKSRVGLVKTMQAGEPVSYGREWTAAGGERVASIPVGYADGYRRLFTNRGYMLIGGRRCRVVGRVCMDQTMVLLPPGLDAAPGDEVVLLGSQGNEEITADEWARTLDTINYEVVCLVGRRVPRVYRNE